MYKKHFSASAKLNNNMLMGLAPCNAMPLAASDEEIPPKTSTDMYSEKPDSKCISTNLDKVKDCAYTYLIYFLVYNQHRLSR